MALDFISAYAGRRLASYQPQPPLLNPPDASGGGPEQVVLDYEVDPEQWTARPVAVPPNWRANQWPERPDRFVDGKDVGETVAWLRAPEGYPVPVRLSEIGAVVVRTENGACRREWAAVERVVSMVVDPFPWDEVEAFATALQQHGFRLLPAEPPGGQLSYDFEEMRKATQNRSNTEMGVLEEAALARGSLFPSVVDGRLEPRSGGFEQQHSPVVGVVKTHSRNYLHPKGLQLLYQLAPGERTPLFALPEANLPVASWYLRLMGAHDTMPNWGVVRVELPLKWFQARSTSGGPDLAYVDCLSRTLCEYRSRDAGYARAAVSLHPIVRAEQLLGALFSPGSLLASKFYRLSGL